MALYLDGAFVGECEFVNDWALTEANVEIGRSGYLGLHYVGFVDEVRIYGRDLTVEDVRGLYENTRP